MVPKFDAVNGSIRMAIRTTEPHKSGETLLTVAFTPYQADAPELAAHLNNVFNKLDREVVFVAVPRERR